MAMAAVTVEDMDGDMDMDAPISTVRLPADPTAVPSKVVGAFTVVTAASTVVVVASMAAGVVADVVRQD